MLRSTLVGLFVIFAFVQSAQSQKLLYSGDIGKKTGLQVITDITSDAQSDYTDPTYRAFKAYQSQQKLTLGANDFYYRLKVRAPSKLISTAVDCKASPFLQSFFQNLLAIGKAALITITANVRYEPSIGENIDIVTNKTPVLMFSEGAQAGQLTTGHGCFLKEVIPAEFAPIRFDGGLTDGKDSFAVNLDISTGEKLDSKAISTALGLFGSASAAVFPWSASITNNVLQTFDKAMSDAGTFQSEGPLNLVLRPRSTLLIKIPLAFGRLTVLEIFPYLSASVILNQKEITPAGVLSSADLAQRTCAYQDVLGGNCKPKPVRVALVGSDYIKFVPLPEKYQLPASIFDPESRPELTLKLCRALRLQLDDGMHLSTVDQMLVRWALIKESGLEKALLDPVLSQKLLAAIKIGTPTATLDDIKTACWNEGDAGVLNAVAGSKLKDS
jgi:hypothetical protein